FLILLITLVLLLGALTFGMRGIMYAQVNEIRIPKEFTGTAMGILICIGFSPEAYVHLIFGYLLDTYKEFAYTLMFATIAAVLFAGALCSGLLYRINKKI
ncbi:MFS transporter, partial [Escherichia coli]|nr:MFS transporter [Escherichia coli]